VVGAPAGWGATYVISSKPKKRLSREKNPMAMLLSF
jgi:hypothetical protein